MDNLDFPKTSSTPAIVTDWNEGLVRMTGDSFPENSFELFQPLIDWVETFLAQAVGPLHLELELVYLNTSSIRAMMDIFDQLEAAHKEGQAVSVCWSHDFENERVGQLAQEFREDCTFPFSIDSKPR
ncbi:MAG: biofilm regulation phosphoprotein SiaC [Rhodoferax sp.]